MAAPAVIDAVPEGTLLVHIGPPKTGTSSLQAAFHRNRAATLRQGVRYAGSSRHSGGAVIALLGRRAFNRDAGAPSIGRWRDLVRGIDRAREPRILLSSEFFADAEPDGVRRAVEDLGRDRIHVVVTLRRLDRLIPSQWQQYVQSNMRLGFEDFLRPTLLDPPGPAPTFWRRHRHDELVARWAGEVGPERVTIVVLEEGRPDHVLRVFEGLTGLQSDTLVADDDVTNRSLTWPEVEAVRAYNIAFDEAGLGNALFHRSMHFGAAAYLKWRVPPPDEPRIGLPDWALGPVADVSERIVRTLEASRIRVIGELRGLVVPRPSGATGVDGDAPVTEPCITTEVAARLAVGLVMVGPAGRNPARAAARAPGARATLERYATYQLLGSVAYRARRRLARLFDARRRGGAPSSSPPSSTAAPASALPRGPAGDLLAETDRQLESEGLVAASGRRLRAAVARLGGASLAREAPGDDVAVGCVPPRAAALLALAVLEATRVIEPVPGPGPAGDRATRMRALRFWWLEPPDLAAVPSSRILSALPGRAAGLVAGRLRRGRRGAGRT